MSIPISSNNVPGNIRQPTPPAARPADSSAVDQTAADFAALLGADPPPEQPKKAEDERSQKNERSGSGDSASESKADSREGERVTRRQRRGESDEESSKDDSDEERQLPSFGDAILEGLSKTGHTSSVDAPAAVDAPPAPRFDNVVQQICDKILVSDPGSGTREVRIILKDSVLPGTEIRLVQDAGKLQVQFVTDNVDSANKLAQHQATLQTLLNEKLSNHEVVVEVAMDSQSGQDMGDGRSRQQRDAKEEYERQENG